MNINALNKGRDHVAGASLGSSSDMDYITIKYSSSGARLSNDETESDDITQKKIRFSKNEFKIIRNPVKNDLP